MPQPCLVLNHTYCRDELVPTTPQCLQLDASLPDVSGLVEPHLAAEENLVGADDKGSIGARGNMARFRLDKSKRTASGIITVGPVLARRWRAPPVRQEN